jgi:uncharacterized protein YndB with AHSA1/START domain
MTKLMRVAASTEGTRTTLRMERRFEHSIHKVWRAITEPKALSAWWCLKIDAMTLELGAALDFYEGDFHDTGTITELVPGRVLAFASEQTQHAVRFELHEDGTGCRLVFTHEFPAGQAPAEPATGWHQCFEGLAAQLDGRPITPMHADAELVSRYSEALAGDRAQA